MSKINLQMIDETGETVELVETGPGRMELRKPGFVYQIRFATKTDAMYMARICEKFVNSNSNPVSPDEIRRYGW